MTKVFFVDIDGVIYKDGKINTKVIDLINKNNDKLVFCTGRGYKRCLDIVGNYISNDSVLILENGSKIVNSKGDLLYYKELTKSEKSFIKAINKTCLDYILYNPCFTDYYNSYAKEIKKYVKNNYDDYTKFYEDSLNIPFTQLTIRFNNNSYSENIYKVFKNKGINVKKSEDYININHKNISKASAIKEYIKMKKTDIQDVVVIGNDYNDLEMFELDCNKIVVKDCYTPKEILDKADYITDFDNLDKVIRRFA